MCKFTNRLFVFVVLAMLGSEVCSSTIPTKKHTYKQSRDDSLMSLFDFLLPDYDYDLHYDQRQKGNENVRVKLDGFYIGLPEQDSSLLLMNSEDLISQLSDELLSGASKSRNPTAAPFNSLSDGKEHSFDKIKVEPKPETTLVVEIPAPKKDLEARQRIEHATEDSAVGMRTKVQLYNLLNHLMKRTQKNAFRKN
ncbi:uncharacterized protein LOC119687096 [Teleopsis dalmanni]|uniref:uncharacterized protein LOC119687096 n=1 Tax=Teleopsis dalmanni TaxID=139649 RepID=UPI0018CD3266|nr:uncharacterized protein LOC119687096 [Teleopsis dalmanni]